MMPKVSRRQPGMSGVESGPSCAHPDVLQLRWRIHAQAGKWDASLDIATTLTTMTPERRFGWIHRAHALDKLGRTLEAKDLLVSVANHFESNSTIPYHLARYCARLGQIDQAKQWLGKALVGPCLPPCFVRGNRLDILKPTGPSDPTRYLKSPTPNR